MFFKSKEAKELERCIRGLQMNLENNYKDLAISSLKEATRLFEQYAKEGKITEHQKKDYGHQIETYANRMKGYSHTDISKFLHDTL